MSNAIEITRNGHRTFFKWHRGRRFFADPVFTGRRILEGMALGASVEVDLVIHADHGLAVLHDLILDDDTTGTGKVRETSAAVLRTLNLRDNAGQPIADKVMLLEDLAAFLVETPPHPDALLQLDFKENAAALDAATVANFVAAVGPVARNMILSAGDAAAVKHLTDATPGLKVGYDPCHDGALEELARTRDFTGFVADALQASPRAEMIYLAYELVLGAADAGFDIVAAFHATGKRIDAYTINRSNDAGVAIANRLLALAVDQITTDDPEGLSAALG
ncbi:glycerophosphodiester phosphodiesterase [Devosia sp.]|uniref:glycerophosphodiester phosphodiesterase n=1 Tax=Devosia sp. TaxID=1871048 RepID=UPI003BABFB37